MVSSSDAAAERLILALELYEVGERMLRQRLRRERPHATPEEIDAEVGRWLRRRPGAEYGDHPGQRSARTL
jgi:Rv0078B-related antitoxin